MDTLEEEFRHLLRLIEQTDNRGIRPSEAMKQSAVYCCVRIIAGALLQVHWRVVADDADDAEATRIGELLNKRIHPRWTAATFREWTASNVLLRGNAYVRIVRDARHRVVRLVPWPWERVRPVSTGVDAPLRYRFDGHGVHADDVLDFPNLGWDGTSAQSTLQAGASGAVAISRDLERYTGAFFRKGSLHRFIVQLTRRHSKREWRVFKRRWRSGSRGVDGSDQPLFVPDGMNVTPVALTNTDAELLANREFQITDILRAFGITSALGNQETRTTSFGSGLSALLHGFARWTLAPHVRRIEAEANAKLAPSDGSWSIKLDMSDLLKATFREQLDAMRVALGGSSGSGILTPNEARRFLGYEPIQGNDEADQLTVFRTRPPRA